MIAGDFIDFAGMSVTASAELENAPNAEEREHGLGSAADHTLAKLRLVMEHDACVMESLARFVAAGNSLVILRGNHDVDWHWESVQAEFRRGLSERAPIDPAAVEFAPWFYYEEGLVFVEHGHQYDAYCSYDHVLNPVSPADPKRTMRSLSDVLLRYVVRPTPGMSEVGHEAHGVADYVRFGWRLGIGGMWALFARFVGATRALVSLWREHVSEPMSFVRREHESRMQRLSRMHQIQLERLKSLARLQRPPITRSLLAIFASVLLDRVLLGLVGGALVVGSLLLIDSWVVGAMAACVASLLVLGLGAAWRKLRLSIEPSIELRERSPLVAKLFPAAFVVMGHTHLPEVRPATAESTYVNLGAWAEEDSPQGHPSALPATRTHLVLARVGEQPVAGLLRWGQHGPEPFTPSEDRNAVLELVRAQGS